MICSGCFRSGCRKANNHTIECVLLQGRVPARGVNGAAERSSAAFGGRSIRDDFGLRGVTAIQGNLNLEFCGVTMNLLLCTALCARSGL